jgi:hypothetical protein
MDWMQLAQDTDQWWAVVNTVMKLWAPLKLGNFLTERPSASQKGNCFMELFI